MKTIRELYVSKLSALKRKLTEIKGEPQKVAMGYALGVFLSASPFIGVKVLAAVILTLIFKWNKIAAVFGALHVNIFTAPVFYGFSFMVGKSVLGSEASYDFSWPLSVKAFYVMLTSTSEVFNILLAGGLVLGLPMSIAAYLFSRSVIQQKATEKSTETDVMDKRPVFTLITGASSGLGKEIAIEYARRQKNLILVALPGRNLKQLCEEIEIRYNIRAIGYDCNLADENSLKQLTDHVAENYLVDRLVNNAGVGGTLKFEDAGCEYLDRIIFLNIRATTMLTLLMLPQLRLHKKALILNIASMAAFGPIPYKTIYPASKAFIYSFSRSLSKELHHTGVKVAVVNPGQIVTNPDVTMRIMHQGMLGKIGLLTAGTIARIAIASAEGGKEVIVPGTMNKVNRILIKWVPEFIRLTLMEKACRKELALQNSFN